MTSILSRSASAASSSLSLPLPFHPFVLNDEIMVVPAAAPSCAGSADGRGVILARDILQDNADYRGLIRAWFGLLRIGGRLLIQVPHAFLCERELALPSLTHPGRRRLYTPATLLSDVEEALAPNSYRIRLLCDDDTGYDYASDGGDADRHGAHAVLAVIERIEEPDWSVDSGAVPDGPPPAFAFEPARTRREVVTLAPRRRIVILKLDHLGDFIMGLPALEKARTAFADAEITLVVGTWNEAMARGLGWFDHVIGFDAFPRNSSEEKVDLGAGIADFERLVPGEYDLAIDLRTDPDTRFFLRHLQAGVRAGMGTRAQFPFLDIFLPVDASRHGFEAAAEQSIEHGAHLHLRCCRLTPYRIAYDADPTQQPASLECLVWGPYRPLGPGEYLYVPRLEIGGDDRLLLELDVACSMKRVTQALASTSRIPHLQFVVEEPGASFEFRILTRAGQQTPSFSFYGGRLLRQGASSVLHQSEYLSLLIDLVKMRTDRFGLLREDGRQP